MSHVTSAGGSGAVLLIALVFLMQQFGLIALSDLVSSIVIIVVAGIAGGVVFGGIAWARARRHGQS
jgi:hypothetical protein